MKIYKQVSTSEVSLTGGFWYEKEKLNREVTLESVRKRFEETGRFGAFYFDLENGRIEPHIFWDSDVAKWMESAAYVLEKNRDEKLEAYVESLIDSIEKNQSPDGYFNSYYQLIEPENRWTNRNNHELYCAGHLIEAAVAYYNATGKDRFLKLMRRFADHIEKVFVKDKSAKFVTPGHEEIELALVKLYNCTKEKRYLDLALYFVDERGKHKEDKVPGTADDYFQSHKPLREQKEAAGHAVRACYIYCAMADLARECGDEELFETCKKLFSNITAKKMYITGGIGSSSNGERFTGDYDLPNDRAYAETCAAISLVLFAQRMTLMSADSLYADTVERAIYNGMISGLSLDGAAFFYENPLEIDLKKRASRPDEHWAPGQRQKVFDCSCCPPNITRIIPQICSLIYTHDDETLFVKQFMSSDASFDMGADKIKITQQTDYPKNGVVKLKVCGMTGKTLALRIPGWCKEVGVKLDGEQIAPRQKDGYLYIDISSDCEMDYEMEMPAFFAESSPKIHCNAGKVAVQKGPVVYCTEGVDSMFPIFDFYADIFERITPVFDEQIKMECLEVSGYRKAMCGCHGTLYDAASGNYYPLKMKFIPYYAFANRGECDMLVWVQKF